MTCSRCSKEYPSDVATCPDCGVALTQGGLPPFPTAPVSSPDANPFNTTLSVSGSSSVRAHFRPRTVGEIFNESFRLYRENWSLFWTLILLITVPFTLLEIGVAALTAPPVPSGGSVTEIFSTMSYVGLLGGIAGLLTSFSLTRAISNSYLGRKVTVAEMIRPNDRFPGFVGASLLSAFVVGAIFACYVAAIAVPAVIVGHSAGAPAAFLVAIPGAIGGIVLMFLCAVWTWLVGPVAVVEGTGATGSMQRAYQLLKGFYRTGFNVMFGGAIAYAIVAVTISSIVHFAVQAVLQGVGVWGGMGSFIAANQLGQLAAAVIALPLMTVPVVLFYYDLRIRKEAFDLQMLAEQLGYGAG